jgi:post-segregation antitoxin (ccd killing protein)
MRALLIALLMSGALQSPAFGQPKTALVSAPSEEALSLAEVAVPRELYLAREMDTARRALLGTLAQNPDMAAFEAEHPGLSKAIWAAAEPETRRYAEAALPEFRALLAAVYQRRLSAAEMRGLRTFFTTPTGRKIVSAMYAPVNVDGMVGDFARDPDAKISQKTADGLEREAKARAGSAVTAEDAPALAELTRTISLAKLGSLGDEVKQVTLEWVNRPDPEFEAKIARTTADAIERFLARDGSR